jgi:hypothetical protein
MREVVIPESTQNLIAQVRERMLTRVVLLVAQAADIVAGELEQAASAPALPAPADDLRQLIRNVLHEEFASHLKDIDYRYGQLRDLIERAEAATRPSRNGRRRGRVHAADINAPVHLLEGYTFTNNSPNPGYVAWADVHIVYKGTDHTIANGNTNRKYLYWALATPNTMQTSDTKPNLGIDDVLVGINDNGIFRLLMTPGKMPHGAALLDGTVGTSEIGNNAITSAKIAALAVLNSHIADGAVTNAKVADGAVTTAKIADSAITGPKIGAGQVATQKLNLAVHLIY